MKKTKFLLPLSFLSLLLNSCNFLPNKPVTSSTTDTSITTTITTQTTSTGSDESTTTTDDPTTDTSTTSTSTSTTDTSSTSIDPTDYYGGISSSLVGAELKTKLFELIKITKAGWSYDELWTAYKVTDVRPDGLHYWDIYSDSSDYTLNDPRINHSYKKEGDSINREHIIPQGSFNEKAPMVSDAHHVLPSDGYVNNRRDNNPHGIVTGTIKYTSNDGCKLGTGTGNTTVFEPLDHYKGDIARMYFYFVTCYQDKMSSNTFLAFNKTTFPSIKSDFLQVYIKWSKDDPVSEKEINRNQLIYETQGNRNPFIDHPEYVTRIWEN